MKKYRARAIGMRAATSYSSCRIPVSRASVAVKHDTPQAAPARPRTCAKLAGKWSCQPKSSASKAAEGGIAVQLAIPDEAHQARAIVLNRNLLACGRLLFEKERRAQCILILCLEAPVAIEGFSQLQSTF